MSWLPGISGAARGRRTHRLRAMAVIAATAAVLTSGAAAVPGALASAATARALTPSRVTSNTVASYGRAGAQRRAALAPQGKIYDKGKHCVKVTSQNNWGGTICVMLHVHVAFRSASFAAKVTFSVRSGGLAEIYAAHLKLITCSTSLSGTSCGPAESASKLIKYLRGPKSGYLQGRTYYLTPGVPITIKDAVGTGLCMDWTNYQAACHPGTLRSK
jgi:hypothetical protein